MSGWNKQLYREYLTTQDWKQKRRAAHAHYGRRSRVCDVCTQPGSGLQLHHFRYRSVFNCKPTDMRFVCDRCHRLIHEVMNRPGWEPKQRRYYYEAVRAEVRKTLQIRKPTEGQKRGLKRRTRANVEIDRIKARIERAALKA